LGLGVLYIQTNPHTKVTLFAAHRTSGERGANAPQRGNFSALVHLLFTSFSILSFEINGQSSSGLKSPRNSGKNAHNT
jgi:hypothetical protein